MTRLSLYYANLFKAHVAIDPDTEIITATVVSAGNAGDASVAEELIADLFECDEVAGDEAAGDDTARKDESEPPPTSAERGVVYGDAAYGTGELQRRLAHANIESKCKTQQPSAKNGMFTKDRFVVDLSADTVGCPAGVTVKIGRHKDGAGVAKFGAHCMTCPLAEQCTTSHLGRKIRVGVHEAALARARTTSRLGLAGRLPGDPSQSRTQARPPHETQTRRKAGRLRVDADFSLLSAAANLACMAKLEVRSIPGRGWAVAG